MTVVAAEEKVMSSMLKKGMSWLGLGPDDEDDYYDDYPDENDDAPMSAPRPRGVASRPEVISDSEWDDPEPGGIRVIPPAGDRSTRDRRKIARTCWSMICSLTKILYSPARCARSYGSAPIRPTRTGW